MRLRLGFIGILVMLCLGIVFTNADDQPNQKIVLQFESSINHIDDQIAFISEELVLLGASNIEVAASVDGVYVITYVSNYSLEQIQSHLEEFKNDVLPFRTAHDELISIVVQDIKATSGDWNINDIPMIEVRHEWLRAQFQPVLSGNIQTDNELFSNYNHTPSITSQFPDKLFKITIYGLPETRAGPIATNFIV